MTTKIEKVTEITIVKGNRYEDDGYLAKTVNTDDYRSCFGHIGDNGAGDSVVTQTGDIRGIMDSEAFDAAATRVMVTGATETFRLVQMVAKPMTREESVAFDREQEAVKNMMTLNGTTY